MAKEIISATVDKDIVKDIHLFAAYNDRTFSNAVNTLLKKALEVVKQEEEKKPG